MCAVSGESAHAVCLPLRLLSRSVTEGVGVCPRSRSGLVENPHLSIARAHGVCLLPWPTATDGGHRLTSVQWSVIPAPSPAPRSPVKARNLLAPFLFIWRRVFVPLFQWLDQTLVRVA